MSTSNEIRRYRDNLRDELDGALLYRALADVESQPTRADLFRQLAEAEEAHAQIWRDKLAALGVAVERYRPSLRARVLARLTERFGPRFVLPSIAAAEFADRDKYADQPDAGVMAAEERGHAAVLYAAVGRDGDGPHAAGLAGIEIAKVERWHRGAASGNDLRAAVLGANDGLVSNFCLVMGVSGAGTDARIVLLTGVAGLVAGACSMALGEWLSVTNARELARAQIAREAEELEHTPEAEQKELALIYQAKGLQRADAERVAARVMQDKSTALDTLVREELGIDPAELGGRPMRAASVSFVLFALGAAVPVAPFLVVEDAWAMGASVAASALALALLGVTTSLFNGRSAGYSALRQVVIGCAAAAVTFGVGRVLGVSLA